MVNTTQEISKARSAARQVERFRTEVGYISPTTGTQPVLRQDGTAMQMPQNAHIICGFVFPIIPLVGGTNVQIGASTTVGGAIATNTGPVMTPAMTTGTNLGAANIPLPLGQNFISCTSTGTFTSGKVRVIFKFADANSL